MGLIEGILGEALEQHRDKLDKLISETIKLNKNISKLNKNIGKILKK